MVNNPEKLFTFDTSCVRKRTNFSKMEKEFKLDSLEFSPQKLNTNIPNRSPKLEELIKKIKAIDAADMKKDGQLYKHFIFCDVKSSDHGAKMIASAMIANGFSLGYDAELQNKNDDNKELKYKKIKLYNDEELKKTKNNFYLLATSVYYQPISVDIKKKMLSKFNERPSNINGDLVRFIIMDSGFKEGIDLFDIKYVHIFEPSVNMADLKQVIGRGTRTCGQSGLTFHPTLGWPLYVYIYDIEIMEKLQKSFNGVSNGIELYLQSMDINMKLVSLTKDIEETSIYGSVDYELNLPVHEFKISKDLKGGTNSDGKFNKITHNSMREYIKENFSHNKWKNIKMENLCIKKENNQSNNKLIDFTPTQSFIRDYFTPQCPVKGMLLWHSTGTGKTCSAIAAATKNFDPQGYTILWVTRTTLKNDIWKNMFQQICNEQIRDMIKSGKILPEDSKKQMSLLSNAWKIKPISYKQFSNLIIKNNNYYDRLVNINGEEDPLRKTLLIIDEAHKLYGGGDLSSIEKPDMNILHNAIMKSYNVSRENSVRLLLMTATPITENPLELVKLINLCKPIQNQIPDNYPTFSNKYLTNEGSFSVKGKSLYLDDIAGHISYLSREKDARQFAQPIIEYINVPLIEDKTLLSLDKRFINFDTKTYINELKSLIKDEQNYIKNELNNINKEHFSTLQEICDDYDDAMKPKCIKSVNRQIRSLLKDIKSIKETIQKKIKQMKDLIDNKNKYKVDLFKMLNTNETDKHFFQQSLYYILKYKCGKTNVIEKEPISTLLNNHPVVLQYANTIKKFDDAINDLNESIKNKKVSFNIALKALKKYSQDYARNDIEKNVVNMNIHDLKIQHKNEMKDLTKSINYDKSQIKDEKDLYIKNFKLDKKQIKLDIKNNAKTLKNIQKTEKKNFNKVLNELRKTQKKMKINTNKQIVELVDEYKIKIKENVNNIQNEIKEKEEKKARKLKEKEMNKTRKLREKEEEKARKLKQKEEEKARKLKQKEEEKARKLK